MRPGRGDDGRWRAAASGRLWRRAWPAAVLSGALSGCLNERALIWPETATAARPASPKPEQGAPPGPSATEEPRAPEADPGVKPAATSADPDIPMVAEPPVVPPAPQEYPIDLTTALRLAEVENPEIATARQLVGEALAQQQQAYALMLPILNAGVTYHGHAGNLIRSSGRILSVSSQSLYIGGGARTLAAESVNIPAVNIASPLTDALYEPLAARQRVAATRAESAATANEVLLDVALLHLDLLRAEASLRLRRETEAEAAEVARLTTAYAKSGQGFQADADRGQSERLLVTREVQRGEEEVAVASARLARRLHLDPVVRMRPVAAAIAPIALIDLSSPTEDLVRVALQRRPEMAARAARIGEAEARYRQELARPLLPTVWLGFSGGVFGGGSNLVPPNLGNFEGRTDFDVRAFWTLQGLGFGNLALQKRQLASVGQRVGEQSETIARIRRELAAARGEGLAAREQVEITRRQLSSALDGFREDLARIRGTVGRPIEVKNSLQLLNQARQDHLAAIIRYNQAQFRLFVALGSPPPLDRPADEPLPPAPVASPPVPPPAPLHRLFGGPL
jgi:outer membrane protein TolC